MFEYLQLWTFAADAVVLAHSWAVIPTRSAVALKLCGRMYGCAVVQSGFRDPSRVQCAYGVALYHTGTTASSCS